MGTSSEEEVMGTSSEEDDASFLQHAFPNGVEVEGDIILNNFRDLEKLLQNSLQYISPSSFMGQDVEDVMEAIQKIMLSFEISGWLETKN